MKSLTSLTLMLSGYQGESLAGLERLKSLHSLSLTIGPTIKGLAELESGWRAP